MSIQINYKGNFGNKIFEYFTALIYAKKHNLLLITPPPSNLKLFEIKYDYFDEFNDNLQNMTINGSHYENDNLVFYGNKNYIFNDFFQNANYLNDNFYYLENIITIKPYCNKINYNISDDDLLCILRMGDFKHNDLTNVHEVVHPNFFLKIAKEYNYKNLYFMIYPLDDPCINEYLSYFSDYNLTILKEIEDELFSYNVVNYFKNIAYTNSTFHWWPIYFCKNITEKNIYASKFIGFFEKDGEIICHGKHIKDLANIRNNTIIMDNTFIKI